MKKLIILIVGMLTVIGALILLKQSSSASGLIWNMSNQGTWLLPLIIFSALLDSIHPCSFSILLITIAFLFGMQMARTQILRIGLAYVAGIFASYLFIGFGILKVLHLFNTPHFMGKLGAVALIVFGVLNILNYAFPKFPIKLRLPSAAHGEMSKLISVASMPAAFLLGGLVGICQFPCMGGPYLMVIGLLKDQVTYIKGASYLIFYNLILIAPLIAVLWVSADKTLLEKMQKWQSEKRFLIKLGGGIIMIILGALIYFL